MEKRVGEADKYRTLIQMQFVLSGGATAIVYEAHDNVTNTQTALKVIKC